MKYKLMVSYDCGISYSQEAEADSIAELQHKAQSLTMWRWCIEDQDGKMAEVLCPIHQRILNAFPYREGL